MEPTYIPKDIAEYEEAIAFGLTVRQLKWGSVSIVTGVGLFLFNSMVIKLPQDLCMYITVAVSFCLFWMGWRKWQNKDLIQRKSKHGFGCIRYHKK